MTHFVMEWWNVCFHLSAGRRGSQGKMDGYFDFKDVNFVINHRKCYIEVFWPDYVKEHKQTLQTRVLIKKIDIWKIDIIYQLHVLSILAILVYENPKRYWFDKNTARIGTKVIGNYHTTSSSCVRAQEGPCLTTREKNSIWIQRFLTNWRF